MADSYPGMPGRYAALPYASPMPYYSDSPQAYGATELQGKFMPPPFMRGGLPRRRQNLTTLLTALLLPWVVFAVVFAVMSFTLHYKMPQLCYVIICGGFVLVLSFGYRAVDAVRKSDQGRDPTWLLFLFFTGLLALMSGALCGNVNYFKNMQPFYDILNLAVYHGTDPAATRGQQMMDAGRIIFQHGTGLDLRRTMAFRNLDTYCVAPITTVFPNGTVDVLPNYDFWAVGLNCCSETNGFRCGEFNNPEARAGLRLMRDDLRSFYRLAVQQAEAAYGIKAIHPIFLYWMQDPLNEVHAYEDDGYKYFSLGTAGYFTVQLFLVIIASLTFVKTN